MQRECGAEQLTEDLTLISILDAKSLIRLWPCSGPFPTLSCCSRGFGNLPAEFDSSHRLVRSRGNISSRMEAVTDDHCVVLAHVIVKLV